MTRQLTPISQEVSSVETLVQIAGSSFERAPWGWLLTFSVIGVIIKGWPAIQDAVTRAKTALGDRRLSRIEKLEAKLEQQSVAHEAEVKILRHQLNNVNSCLDAILLLIEAAPDRASEHVAKIRVMRAEQSQAERAEKNAIQSAKIVAAGAAVKEVEA